MKLYHFWQDYDFENKIYIVNKEEYEIVKLPYVDIIYYVDKYGNKCCIQLMELNQLYSENTNMYSLNEDIEYYKMKFEKHFLEKIKEWEKEIETLQLKVNKKKKCLLEFKGE